jgi:replicative DNA helicase
MIKKYAFVRNGKIKTLRNVPADDALIIKKMLAHGYLLVDEEVTPAFDNITQSLSDSYEIKTEIVMRKWAIVETSFDEAKSMKEEEIKSKALDYIAASFDSQNEILAITDTLIAKKAEFLTALATAQSNSDLRKITVDYTETEKK